MPDAAADTRPRLIQPAGLRLLATPLLMLVLLCAPARAQDSSLSLSCAVCHGSAEAPSRMPALYGLRVEQIDTALREFRSGARAGTAMPRLAQGLTDADIRALAQRFGRGTR